MTGKYEPLTPLEARCLALAAHGRTQLDMMRETDIPMERIGRALDDAMRKLGARNLAEAICRAARKGLIS